MSSVVHSVYGMTVFGGPGDYQSLACGGNSQDSQPWYVASSQRYGCHVHLQLTANAKCLVVQTEDAGPATFVENDAGIAVLDSGPQVAEYFFGVDSLGWSDLKDHPGRYDVHVSVTTAPLGPCDSGGGSDDSGSGGGTSGGSTGGGTTDAGTTGGSSGGTPCTGDGDCNPGNDGSGKICVSNACVPGCHHDYQCPGITTCVSGMCE